jgi:ribosomal-protein-alanine N-acetyltransferase
MARPPGWPATLSAGAVVLRPPRLRDGPAWGEIRMRNEAWLRQWEPTFPGSWRDRNGVGSWPPMSGALKRAAKSGTTIPFLVMFGGRLAGQLTIANIVHGSQRSATIGYWVDQMWAGRGITPVAVALAADHCFTTVGLHRVELDIRPENKASLRVAAKLGFRKEGYLERFLDIDNGWRDHVMFALTSEDLGGRTVLSRLSVLPTAPG